MVTHASQLRFHIRLLVWRHRPDNVPIQSIYDFLDSVLVWDEDDQTPPKLRGSTINEPSWKRNVRNVLKRDTDKGILDNSTRAEYSWTGSTTPEWVPVIIEALERLGGEAKLVDIYKEIEKSNQRELTSAWKNTINGAIERKSSDSDNFDGMDIFYSVHGIGRGEWGLRPEYRLGYDRGISNVSISLIKEERLTNLIIEMPSYAQRTIAMRRGQPQFRQRLLDAYESCMITGCKDRQVLEACHIIPYSISHDNSLENGLLLRADIHTLLDLGLLSIDEQLSVHISDDLDYLEYKSLDGNRIQSYTQLNHSKLLENIRYRMSLG